MRLVELFSGIESVGKVVEQLGYEVTSWDSENADIHTDILSWVYTIDGSKHFGVIWALPPCTQLIRALTTGKRNISAANQIVLETL